MTRRMPIVIQLLAIRSPQSVLGRADRRGRSRGRRGRPRSAPTSLVALDTHPERVVLTSPLRLCVQLLIDARTDDRRRASTSRAPSSSKGRRRTSRSTSAASSARSSERRGRAPLPPGRATAGRGSRTSCHGPGLGLRPEDFLTDVMPILSRAGCNAGRLPRLGGRAEGLQALAARLRPGLRPHGPDRRAGRAAASTASEPED